MTHTYAEAQRLLTLTFDQVKGDHSAEGHDYIRTHWQRYVHLVMRLPQIGAGTRVLEVGASILSSLIRLRFGAQVAVVHHPLEPQWTARCARHGITSHSCELLLSELPVADNTFDLILFSEVMEHFPVHPGFFLARLFGKLTREGILQISVPNFATSEKRLHLLRGGNPQDQMDKRFIYYAHHREPVMAECLDLVRENGGETLSNQWVDWDVPPGFAAGVWYLLRCMRHGRFHALIHYLVPSTRGGIFLETRRAGNSVCAPEGGVPPLRGTLEYLRHP